MYHVLSYLEETMKTVNPEKIAYQDDQIGINFGDVYKNSRAIGTFLAENDIYKQPVVVFMKKSPKAIVSCFGVIYGGNYYVNLDEDMPDGRVELIFEMLNPKAIICDEHTKEKVEGLTHQAMVLSYEEIIKTTCNDLMLENIREKSLDTDPIYIVFTSGSTGTPKGVVACHRSVIDYIENLVQVLGINEDTVYGLQSPLYFDACLKEIYPTLKFGATTVMVPKKLFMFPIKLVEFMNTYKINTVCWVVSALTMISALKVLDKMIPEYLHTVAFGSEVFPIKQFNIWREALPNARFINLYGPTEATGMSCYYEVNRSFEEGDAIPIGKPFKNTEIMLLDDKNQLAEQGEICIRGTCLTMGYFKAFDRTSEVFVQNPLNDLYPEFIYRTGDIAKYNEQNELVFISRKDHQIKHMGHRIELGEIEANVNNVDGINSACCVYDKKKERIILFYVGTLERRELLKTLKQTLPIYMLPNKVNQLDQMPLTANGKMDRKALQEGV